MNERESVFAVGRAIVACTLVVSALAVGTAVAQDWQKIQAPAQSTVVVNGQSRDIAPRCIAGGEHNDASYSFYFKRGTTDKLVVFFNGGGACWNGATCIVGANPPALYVPTADTPLNDPRAWGGLFDTEADENPFKDWNVAFLPYCTGDVHIGSKTTQYAFGPYTAAIAHHGFDNFLFARDWLGKNGGKVKSLLVTGSSAGAYGAALNYGHLKETFPHANAYLAGDGGNGVITSAFMDAALDSSWGGAANLPPALAPLRNFASEFFLPAAYGVLTARYPRDLFSQYTTAWDGVQTLVYNVMLHADAPQEWLTTLGGAVVPWHVTMRTFAYANAVAPNYRYYIAPGCAHTILRFDDRFYSDATVGNISFRRWLAAQTTPNALTPTSAWKNRDSCVEPSGCPPPSVEQLLVCAQQPG